MTGLKRLVDPFVDYVFKKILGSRGNEHLLIDFLNGILKPVLPIRDVKVINPFTDKEKLDDKLSVLDILAEDERGHQYQVEVQVTTPVCLSYRMLHNWAGVYQQQIKSGESFAKLKPVLSVWLLSEPLFRDIEICHLTFESWDHANGIKLSEHMQIHVLQLSKWHKPDRLQVGDNWLYFFKEGGGFKALPSELEPFETMRCAMAILREISEKEQDYHRYRAREEFLRIQLTEKEVREELEQKYAKAQTQLKSKDEQLHSQDEQLKTQQEQIAAMAAKLKAVGIDPDEI
jgi:predicted transposase/invertase (TIGR01784 family)